MRFSLATLVLTTLFSASLIAVWTRHEPWYLHRIDLTKKPSLGQMRNIAPDGTRILKETSLPLGVSDLIQILEKESKTREMYTLYVGTWNFAGFLDDNTIDVYTLNPKPLRMELKTYRRRFPEWWWGHFYRPEVWASIALGITLLVRAIRARRIKAVGSVQQ